MRFKRYMFIMIALVVFCAYDKVAFAAKIENAEITILMNAGHGGIDGGAQSKSGTIREEY